MKARWLETAPEADERQEARFEDWVSGRGIPFVDAEAERAYRERATLIKDAIQLKKKPERIPICPSAGFFPISYAGRTMHEAMYDYEALTTAWQKYCFDFAPDAYNSPMPIIPGKVLDILDVAFVRWPGHGVPDYSEYQYVEKEYMKADEYQDLIDDPTGYFLNVWFPRVLGAAKPLERVPLLPPVNEVIALPPALIAFGTPEVQAAFQNLMAAGSEALKWIGAVRRINESVMGKGFPSFSGGFTKAPFDVIGDTLRGTTGVLMDLYRRPEEVIEACERITPFMIKAGVASCKASGHIMPFIPLHKGADGFMSNDQFKTFYWPTLRKLIIGLVNEGIVPQLFAEGGYNQRLEIISDIPKGKTVWWFDATDMGRAKETVGQVACIAGNVPVSVLATGNYDDVKSCCTYLMETAGKGGGFLFSTGAGMQGSKVENVKAMMDFARELARYT
ncbi:MAG: uroporphyrinogen decarboxylase family protein [Pseudomonadota bacterium]